MSHRLFSQDKLEKIYNGAVTVLVKMGMKVENRRCLEAMEKFGAKIDWSQERAFISSEVIDRMLQIVKPEHAGWKDAGPKFTSEYSIGGGGTCPFIFDEEISQPRRANETDCIEAFKILETSPAVSCGPPVSNSDCSPKYEAIRCLQLGIETLNKTRMGGTDLFFVEQVPFVVELGELCSNNPTKFLPVGRCPTSPLTVSKLIADLTVTMLPYGVSYAVPTMPVMGINAPMTPAGTAVIGVAEILGGYVLAKALDPQIPVSSCALSALMNMRTGNMTYIAPEVFIADTAIAEVFKHFLNLPCRVFGIYVDAKTPGLKAVQEKLIRSLGLGLYGNQTGLHGTLDQGKLFSPTQMMLDYELHSMLACYTAEPIVDKDSLGLEAIMDIAWDSTGYMMHEHTLSHMRDTWQSVILGRENDDEGKVLDIAREQWNENLSKYEPPNHSDDFLRELRDISNRAKKALN